EVSAMSQVHINYVAVVVAALVPMILGMVWYAPSVFGNVWMQLIGKKPEDLPKDAMPQAYAMMFLAALVLSFVLAHVLRWDNAMTLLGGVNAPLATWIGSLLTTTAVEFVFEGRPIKLSWLQNGYWGVARVTMGI